MTQTNQKLPRRIEWPTLALIAATYLSWVLCLWVFPLWLGVILGSMTIALHSSLQHEIIHGHPFRVTWLNEALVWLPLGLAFPFSRFKATHLSHHTDNLITDPYDDPESNFLDPAVWAALSPFMRRVLTVNNTLFGRLALGPLIGTIGFLRSEWRGRTPHIIRDWLLHLPAVAAVLWIVAISSMPIWAYCIAAYVGLSILKLRTFLEHQAHVQASGRSVIVEDRGLFAFLFLNNNLHCVHHTHPNVAWYDLPALYRSRREHYLRRNKGYLYRSYAEVARQYLWRPKDPVAHPLWRR
jgi:fatty acid desaturase